MEFLIWLIISLFFLAIGFIFGRTAENRHFRSLERREEQTKQILITDTQNTFFQIDDRITPTLICSETVIATDYLKNFLSGFRHFFGGTMHSYAFLYERARREVIVSLKEKAHAQGYNALCNLRVEMADIGGTVLYNKAGKIMAPALASATAYKRQ